MSEVKRGSLQSPADSTKSTDTITRHVQHVDATGKVQPAGDSASNPIHVSTGGAIASVVGDGRQTVPTPGTAVALAGSTAIKEVTITAEEDNEGVVVSGGSTVVADLATRRGTPSFAMDSVTILADDLAEVFIDAVVAGEGVTYTYIA